MNFLLNEANWIFSTALVVVFGIGVLELVALLVGGSVTSMMDGVIGDAPDAGGLAWLHVGRLPFLVILVLFLTTFSLLGFTLQGVMSTVFGQGLPALAATPLALIGALPATRATGSVLMRIMPRDESSAIAAASFVGRTATLTGGDANPGKASEARFQDEYGQTHYVMVEPEISAPCLHTGDRVLLVRELSVGRYRASLNPITE
ncbi:MAG: YqiJ family protein [Thiobacillus sp.]